MADGTIKLSPAEARAKADQMEKTANEIQDLLNDILSVFNEIDNSDTGTYQGSRSAGELKANLDAFSNFFPSVYNQIIKSAGDIKLIANTMEQE